MAFRDFLHTLESPGTSPPRPEFCIVDHLNWMLNSRRDRHPHLVGYGLPDLHDFLTRPDPEAALAAELRKVIERCEPRLAHVRVFPDAGPEGSFTGRLQARFIIEAQLVGGGERLEFREEAEIDQIGNVAMR